MSSPAVQLATLGAVPLEREFPEALSSTGQWPLRPFRVEILQLNVGKVCNQTCRHCHVDAGPDRTETMSRETMEHCLRALAGTQIRTVDLTGGAPELNPHFRWLVGELRERGLHVIDRCNLTVLQTAPHRDLVEFLAGHRVEVVCSLPHFRALATDRQRGEGVYQESVAALKRLNAVGYGDGCSGLRLVLVSNPVGAFLPGSQASLEAEWKRELFRLHGIRFDALYALTNLPISRFLEWLESSGNLESYLQHLVQAFNPATVSGLMCRNTLSVGWDGRLYDCDFNQMLELGVDSPVSHVARLDLAALEQREIRVGRHCFGCTAGAGSSCGGATT
ncbi:MAG TPA: arsenosugar biosynthesis radical SAM (seleno)protein ArsS [Myxococcaceae bacterium]|nr:arsenosugar biosynthesis radical SAM (seleno)protein ArsS [Myxococcaceae bacterium]